MGLFPMRESGFLPAMNSIRLTESVAGYPVIEIHHPLCSARVATHGAHVMEWHPVGQEAPVLYLSPTALLQPGKAIRGGIPICWPWFNANPSDPSKPSHGIARNRFWSYDGATENEQGVTLRLSLSDDETTRAIWPHAFRLEAEIFLGAVLELKLTTHNLGTETIPLSGALHTYLNISDVGSITVQGLEQAAYLDCAGRREEMPATGEALVFREEVDRIYHAEGAVELFDPGWKRTIVVEKSGSPSLVAWNPWIEKASALADLPDADFHKFICLEATIANESAISVLPGGEHTLSTRLSVK
jgi:glucose-6-phosphate 1-epimerase